MFLKDKKVLVTGGGGFIGSHLVEELVKRGAKVKALCLYNSRGSWGWLDYSDEKTKRAIEVYLGDIRDKAFMEKITKDIDIIFHLAALIAIPYSYQAPESFIDVNIKGTLNILESSRKNKVKRVIHISTSEVYGTPEKIPINEKNELKGQSPYSASKIGADKICEAYYNSYNLPVVIIRPFNTYGPRQSMRAVIPTILVQILKGKKEIRLGNLKPKRDLTYVEDTVEGIIKAAEKEKIEGETIQLGTGVTKSIKEIAELAMEISGKKVKIIKEKIRIRPDKSEVMILQSDPSKAKIILDWKAEIDLKMGLEKTYKWFEKNLNLYKGDYYHI